MEFKEIQQGHQDMRAEVKAIDARIDQREMQIERLKRKREKKDIFWGDTLIRPIMEEVKKRFKQLSWGDDRLVPMGLRSAVSVFAKDESGKTVASLVFVIGNYNDGQLFIETGLNKDGKFAKGTIGDLNGFSRELTDVKSLVTIFDRVTEQLDGILVNI